MASRASPPDKAQRLGGDDMLEFAKEFLFASRRNLAAWFGVVSLVLGVGSAVTDKQLAAPRWTWFLFSTLAFAAMALQSECKAYQARRAETVPDITLKDVLVRITGSDSLKGEGVPKRIGDALLALREKALHGRIKVWGRLGVRTTDSETYPRREIEQNYWSEYEIPYMKTISNDFLGETEFEYPSRMAKGETLKIYTDLWFSRAQIDKIWPLRKSS
jgi:hypothetical protein